MVMNVIVPPLDTGRAIEDTHKVVITTDDPADVFVLEMRRLYALARAGLVSSVSWDSATEVLTVTPVDGDAVEYDLSDALAGYTDAEARAAAREVIADWAESDNTATRVPVNKGGTPDPSSATDGQAIVKVGSDWGIGASGAEALNDLTDVNTGKAAEALAEGDVILGQDGATGNFVKLTVPPLGGADALTWMGETLEWRG